MTSRHRLPGIVTCCLLAAGCGSNLVKNLVDIAKLRTEIVKKFGEEAVNVRLTNRSELLVIFVNSQLNDRTGEERSKRAQETALVVKAHYAPIRTLKAIFVGFLRQESRFGVIHYGESIDHFVFDNEARALNAPGVLHPPENGDDSQPLAYYSPTLRQTDISITNVHLEGEPSAGLTLVPHFTLVGDATKNRSIAPATVSFDFASYSGNQKFPALTRVSVFANRRVVFETKSQFSTGKLPDGTFSEYLYLQIPYPVFREITAAKNVSLKVGTREYELTDHQVAGLRQMTEYVKE